VTIEQADTIPEGWAHWMKWVQVLFAREGQAYAGRERAMLKRDAGRNLGLTRLVARRELTK
jgi:hypothetical protein